MRYMSTALAAVAAFFVLPTLPIYAATFSKVGSSVRFSPTDTEASLISRGVTSIKFGNTSIYIGYTQASSINKNPIIASYTNGVRNWVRTDYETTGADGAGRGLLSDGAGRLYAVFTTDGTQGTPSQDYRRFTGSGWLPTYGPGGGPTVSVLLRLNPKTGAGIVGAGTFIRANLQSNGRTNTLRPTGLNFFGDQVVFLGSSFYAPLGTDRKPMTQTTPGGSPFQYRAVFNANLTQALRSEAIGWNGVTAFAPLTTATASRTTSVSAFNFADLGDTDNDDPTSDSESQSVPEPSLVLGAVLALGLGALLKRDRTSLQLAVDSPVKP